MKFLMNDERGSMTLGVVFGLGMLGLAIAATTMLFSHNTLINNSNAAAGVRSLVTADAAVREGINQVLAMTLDPGDTLNDTINIPLLNGTSNADVTVTGTWPVFEISGNANNTRTTRKVLADINLFPSAFAFDQAVYTHGELEIHGGANTEINGDIYATGDIELSGNPNLNGDISSHGEIDPVDAGISNHPIIEPPILDSQVYENFAFAAGTTANNDVQAQDFMDNYDNVIVHITSPTPTSISGTAPPPNGAFNGMLIVDGDLSLSGGAELTAGAPAPYDDIPIALYVKGDLTFTGNATIHGIVYVEGETSFGAGNVTIDGSLLSVNGANDLDIGGSVEITYNQTYADMWENLFDDGALTGADPAVSRWREE